MSSGSGITEIAAANAAIVAWVFLSLAVVCKIGFALSMKASKGFTILWPSIMTTVGVVGGVGLLTMALRTLPVSVGYPIWVGAGVVGTVIFGYFWFGEALSPLKVASVSLIVLGVVGLKLSAVA